MSSNLDFSNKNFQLASSFIRYTKENVFLTGKAGTGKTTFLKHIKDKCNKNFVLTAPTGVAAINAGGVTLHSFFQLPLGTFIADFRKNWGAEEDQYIVNRHQLLSKLRFNNQKRKLIRELELLIIDEISMVRADTMDAVDQILRHVRNKPNNPFGGVQLLLIGDLYQLPPVVRNNELLIMSEYYRSPFFFDAISFQDSLPLCIELTQIYRQDDSTFIDILNNIRNNEMTQEDYEILNERYFPGFTPNGDAGIITLTSHNAQADEINQNELLKLPSKERILNAKVTGDFPENAFPMEKELLLKEGAQVMFIKNDKGESRRYYNGKIGTVNRINVADKEIDIYFPKEKNSIKIQPEAWENVKFKLNEEKNSIEEDIVGTFEQFPFRLAWAVTIHKSQGLTFDEAVIDAGKSFAAGQVYVALSRMTNMKGMILRSKITPSSVKVDERIIEFMKNRKSIEIYLSRLENGQYYYLLSEMAESYLWQDFIFKMDEYLNDSISVLTQEVIISNQIYQSAKSSWFEMDKVGRGFVSQLQKIYNRKNWEELSNRIEAANTWYEEQINSYSLEPFKEWIESLKIQKGGAKAAAAIKFILNKINLRLNKIKKLHKAIQVLSTSNDIQKCLDTYSQIEILENSNENVSNLSNVVPDAKKIKSADISIELFLNKKSVEQIAEDRGMAKSTILGHLIQGIGLGQIHPTHLIDEMTLLDIVDKIKQNPHLKKLNEIKQLLGDDYSYEDIRIAIAYYDRLTQPS